MPSAGSARTFPHPADARRPFLLRWPAVALLLAAGAALTACERPFVAPTPPEIELLAPDPQQVFTDSITVIKARATSFRTVTKLMVDGRDMVFDPIDDTWVDTVSLDAGLNEFQVSALDDAGVEGARDVTLLRLKYTFSEGPSMPAPFRIGEQTATLLSDGRLLLLGGVQGLVEPALSAAFVLDPGATSFRLLQSRMIHGRTGHTAGTLPDGRILILGGATRGAANQLFQLIPDVEIFNPATNRFTPVPFVGEPIGRVYHVMFITTDTRGVVIDIQGGIGKNNTDRSSELEPLRTFRTFRLARDTLFSVGSGGISVDGIGQIYSHTVAPLTAIGSDGVGEYLVGGSYFTETTERRVNFTIDFASAPLRILETGPYDTGRYRHATAALQPGIVFSFGGRAFLNGPVLQSSEVYVSAFDTYFQFANPPTSQRRHGHTATKMPGGRILLVGGFIGNGDALTTSEYFDPGFGF
ncbi:MAG: kelch repeat-containing protein [Rhodothermales bacterium]